MRLMSDPRTIAKRKQSFHTWLAQVPRELRRARLLELLRDRGGGDADPATKVFAGLAFVQLRLYHGKGQGARYLRAALRGLAALCGGSPRSARFRREAANVAGNFHAR